MNKKSFISLIIICFIALPFYSNNSGLLNTLDAKPPEQMPNKDKNKNTQANVNKFIEIGGIKFVKIPAGSFMMGSPENEGKYDERPQHKVILDSFYMGIYEITQKQYQEIMGKNPSNNKGDNHPVEQVSWENAMEFCKKFSDKYKVTARLPTEAEWEYACRAGTTTKYYWGDTINNDYGWFGKHFDDKTHPVGEKKPNAWGLYDMVGNVWEWCMDWYNDIYFQISPENNPQGPNLDSYRVLRGNDINKDTYLRSASRSSDYPTKSYGTYGFRIVVVP